MSCAQTHIHDRALLQPGCQPHQLCSGTRPGISDKLVRPVPSSLPPWVHLEGHSHFFLPLQSSDSIFNKFSSFWANTYMRSSHGPDLFGSIMFLARTQDGPPRQQPLKNIPRCVRASKLQNLGFYLSSVLSEAQWKDVWGEWNYITWVLIDRYTYIYICNHWVIVKRYIYIYYIYIHMYNM